MALTYPTVPYPLTLPFYYSSLTNVGVFYSVPVEQVVGFIPDGLNPAVLDDQAVVSYNMQVYTGQVAAGRDVPPEQWLASASGVTQELELNVVCYPTVRADQVVDVTLRQFLADGEQSKLLGNHRVHVPCDDPLAIQAGVELFGEPKFKTTFKVNLASPNPNRQDTSPYEPEWVQTNGFRVDDPDDPSLAIFTAVVDTRGLVPIPGNFSPITEYGMHPPGEALIGCRWNILQPMDTFFIDGDPGVVSLEYGESTHQMKADMQALIGDAPPVAVRTYNSAPAAIQSRAYLP